MMMADMPTYEYRCDNGHTFEEVQSMSEDALTECTICGAPAQRILFAPAVHFKGSGFYTTDYARKGGSKAANGAESSKSSDSKESKSSDSGSSDSGSSNSSGSSKSDSSSGSSDKASAKKD
jgi:putative FmdB family regulatory protein